MSTTSLVFIILFGAALLAALVRHPMYGLYAYVAVFYLHPVERWWGRDLPDLRWSLLAAVVTILATLRLPARDERAKWNSSGIAKLLLALTAWMWIQNLWALDGPTHLEASILFTKYVILFYLMYKLLDTEEAIEKFLMAHVLGCLYLGWLVLDAPDTGRLEGVGGPGIDEANALGMHLSTGAIAAAALLVRGNVWCRALALAAIPLILNGIIQTESRGAFLGLVAGAAGMLYLSPKIYQKYWFVFGIIGLAVLVRMAPENYWDRIETIFAAESSEPEEVDQSTQTRFALFDAQWKMFVDYPLGSGHRGTAYLSPRYLGAEHLTRSRDMPTDSPGARSSHNTFMTAVAEQGVPGLIIYPAMVWWCYQASRRVRRETAAVGDTRGGLQGMVAGASFVAVCAAGLFTDYFKAEVQIWSFVMLACLLDIGQRRALADAAAADSTPASRGSTPVPAAARHGG